MSIVMLLEGGKWDSGRAAKLQTAITESRPSAHVRLNPMEKVKIIHGVHHITIDVDEDNENEEFKTVHLMANDDDEMALVPEAKVPDAEMVDRLREYSRKVLAFICLEVSSLDTIEVGEGVRVRSHDGTGAEIIVGLGG